MEKYRVLDVVPVHIGKAILRAVIKRLALRHRLLGTPTNISLSTSNPRVLGNQKQLKIRRPPPLRQSRSCRSSFPRRSYRKCQGGSQSTVSKLSGRKGRWNISALMSAGFVRSSRTSPIVESPEQTWRVKPSQSDRILFSISTGHDQAFLKRYFGLFGFTISHT